MSKKVAPRHETAMDVSALRRSPAGSTLERKDLRADAIEQFEDWFRQACDSDMLDPNAMSLATVDNTNKFQWA